MFLDTYTRKKSVAVASLTGAPKRAETISGSSKPRKRVDAEGQKEKNRKPYSDSVSSGVRGMLHEITVGSLAYS